MWISTCDLLIHFNAKKNYIKKNKIKRKTLKTVYYCEEKNVINQLKQLFEFWHQISYTCNLYSNTRWHPDLVKPCFRIFWHLALPHGSFGFQAGYVTAPVLCCFVTTHPVPRPIFSCPVYFHFLFVGSFSNSLFFPSPQQPNTYSMLHHMV